jgi:DNA-binding transcriptional MerR regulator
MTEGMMAIGEVARRAGVSVQTLRHYDKLGLLLPTNVTKAGYRLYSAQDRLRLELIRSLREVGFDLGTIGELLKEAQEVRDAVALRLELIETQLRALRRQRVLLKVVLDKDEPAMLSRLRRLDVLARLGKLEREAFLAKQLGWDPEQTRGNSDIWEAAVLNLPEGMNEAQLEAWLELAEIAADESFRHTLQRQGQPFAGVDDAGMQGWTEASQALMARAVRAVERDESVAGKLAQDIVAGWVEGLADALGKTPDAEFARWMLGHFEATSDPRFDRYWQLVAILKGWSYTNTYAQAAAWLLEGLRVRVRALEPTPH